MDNLFTLRAFRRVVESCNFTRAAEQLKTTPGNISKLVAQLEQHLGARLLQRSTRSMSMTEAGRIYYEYCVRILDEVENAERAVQQLVDVPRGTLRVSVPTSFGILWLNSRLPAFLKQYPDVRLDVVANDQQVDIVEGGFDLALRVSRKLQDSSMVAKLVGEIPHVVVASPTYLAERGTPSAPTELANHNCLVYTLTPAPGEWMFQVDGNTVMIGASGNYQCNNSAMLRGALTAGIGITQTPLAFVEDLLESQQLVACLEAYRPPPLHVFLMLPEGRAVSPKVRAFMNFISHELNATR